MSFCTRHPEQGVSRCFEPHSVHSPVRFPDGKSGYRKVHFSPVYLRAYQEEARGAGSYGNCRLSMPEEAHYTVSSNCRFILSCPTIPTSAYNEVVSMNFSSTPNLIVNCSKNWNWIIIDEISMVRADIIDAVDRILRVYSRNLREPFGGKQILLVGDVFQLEPVVKGDEREILNRFYPTPYFFLCKSFQSDRSCIDRTAKSLSPNGCNICRRIGPHTKQYSGRYRPSTAQHPLWHTNRGVRSGYVYHSRHPPRQCGPYQ